MSSQFSAAVSQVIEDGIKRPIRLLLDNNCHPAALILTYSGIEMMTFLSLPLEKKDVMRSDFIAWAERYMVQRLSRHGLTGKDLYGARCSAFRGTDSRLVREGHCAIVRLSAGELANALFAGIDSFLRDVERDNAKTALVKQRLTRMCHTLPF